MDHKRSNEVYKSLGDKQSVDIVNIAEVPDTGYPDIFVVDIPVGGKIVINCDGINGGLEKKAKMQAGADHKPFMRKDEIGNLLNSLRGAIKVATLAKNLVAQAGDYSGDNDTAIVIQRNM